MTPDGARRAALAAGPVAAGLVLLVPAASPARAMGAVVVLVAIWWLTEALPLGATALVPFIVLPAAGVASVRDVASCYADPLILLFLSGFLLARGMSAHGVDRWLATRVVGLAGTGPRSVLLALMGVTAFLSMWVSNSATAAMMMPVGVAVAGGVAREGGRARISTAFMLGIAYAASIGGIGTLVGTPPNVILAGVLKEQLGLEVSFAQWMLVGVPVVLIALPSVWIWLIRYSGLPREGDGEAKGVSLVLGEGEKADLSVAGRRAGGVIVLAAVAWVSRPLWDGWLATPGAIHDASVGMLFALALFIVPSGRGSALLEGDALAKVPWNVLLLFGGGLALAKGMQSSGLARAVAEGASGWGALPLPVFLAGTILAMLLLTEIASNTASTALMLPFLAAVAIAAGIDPPVLLVPVAMAASMAFMMPAATPPNAIVFGSGWVRIRQMAACGAVANLIGLAILVAAGLLWVGRVL